MATKAELEKELAALKKELAAQQAEAAAAGAEAADEIARAARSGAEQGMQAMEDFLKSHGIDTSDLDIEGIWQRLSGEVSDFTARQPMLTVIACFGLGFILGRMSR